MLNHLIGNDVDIKLYVDVTNSNIPLADAGIQFFLYDPDCQLVELTPSLFGSDERGEYAMLNVTGQQTALRGQYDIRVQSATIIGGQNVVTLPLFNGDAQSDTVGALFTASVKLGFPARPLVVAPKKARLNPYLWVVNVTTPQEPNTQSDFPLCGCSTFYGSYAVTRNFDFNYDDTAEVYVKTQHYQGMAYVPGLRSGQELTDTQANQAPFYLVDGIKNFNSIVVSTHVVFNDAGVVNTPDGYDTTRLVHDLLSKCDSAASIQAFLGQLKAFRIPDSLYAQGYVTQWFVRAGSKSYVIRLTSTGAEMVELPANRLTNFDPTKPLEPTDHPVGLERYDLLDQTSDPSDLAYTNAYTDDMNPWLSEFIGIHDTNYATLTDAPEVLEAIRAKAAALYANRRRDGQTWHTVHSVEYDYTSSHLLGSLNIQEDFNTDYASIINAF